MTDPSEMLMNVVYRNLMTRALTIGTVTGKKGLISGHWCEHLREAGLLACNPADYEAAHTHEQVMYWPTKASLEWRA